MTRNVTTLTRDLPPVLQSVLKEIGYNKRDISIVPRTSYSVQSLANDGEKAFTAMVNLRTGEYRVVWGSWGGEGFGNAVDRDRTSRPIPDDGAVIQGSKGYHGVWAQIYLNPQNLSAMLPAPTDLTPVEKKALRIVKDYNSRGRREEFDYQGLGGYGASNPLIQSLLAKGLVKVTASGAVSLTLEGKNAL